MVVVVVVVIVVPTIELTIRRSRSIVVWEGSLAILYNSTTPYNHLMNVTQ